MIIDEKRTRTLPLPPAPTPAPLAMSSKRREALGPDLPPAPLVPRTRKGQPYNAPPTNAPPYSAPTAAYPPAPMTPTRTPSQPLHQMSLGAITPNTLLFRDAQGPLNSTTVVPPPPSKPGEITPNLLLLPDSQFAMTQPAGMVTAAYPTTAAPSAKAPGP
jgi:hypothetical protein